MKSKIIFLFFLFFGAFTFAQSNKYYSDWQNGYSGTGSSKYYENESAARKSFDLIYEMFSEIGESNGNIFVTEKSSHGMKLSKEEEFIFLSALNEYDYKDGEFYSIAVNGSCSGGLQKNLLIKIINNGKSYLVLESYCLGIRIR